MVDKCAVSVRSRREDCEDPPEPLEPCPPVEFCAGNKTVVFDGRCLSVEDRQYQIPDGTWSTITFEGGCIVGVGLVPDPQYTPNDCCGPAGADPVPGGDMCVSQDPANLAQISGGCILVKPTIIGRGVDVTGSGTTTDPWVISASIDPNVSVFIRTNTPEQLEILGSGTSVEDPIVISLKPVVESGTYGPFTVNEYGQIIGYTDPGGGGTPITNITGISPIKVEQSNGVAVISYEGGGNSGGGSAAVGRAIPTSITGDSASVFVTGVAGLEFYFSGDGVSAARYPAASNLKIPDAGSISVTVPIIENGTRGAVVMRDGGSGTVLDGFVV